MIDRRTIEEEAVDAVKRKLRTVPFVSPSYITTNDKEPSWDGNVYIYQDAAKQKKDGIKALRTQVKGTENDAFDKAEITFDMSVADLSNYRDNGGIILFVVYVRASTVSNGYYETKIYYESLTPLHIIQLLKSANKVSKAVPLHELPDNSDRIYEIIRECYEDNIRQTSFAAKEPPTLDSLLNAGIVDGLSVPFFRYGKDNGLFASFLSRDRYVYAKIKGTEALLPVQGPITPTIVTQTLNFPVTVKGEQFYSSYVVAHTKDGVKIKIGSSVVMKIFDDKPSKINYTGCNSLRNLATDLSFLLAFIDDGGFELNGARIDYNTIDESSMDLGKQRENLEIVRGYIKALDYVGCSDDLDLSKLTAKDYRNLAIIATASENDGLVEGLNGDIPLFFSAKISNLTLLVMMIPQEGKKGAYRLTTALDNHWGTFFVPSGSEQEPYPVPCCSAYQKNDYLNANNIPFDRLVGAYNDFVVNPALYDMANTSLLRMIDAIDEATGERKDILLKTSLELAEWLKKIPDDVWDNRIAQLNYLQVVKRQRELNEEEKEILEDMIDESTDREDIIIAANILLGHMRQAKKRLAAMDRAENDNFKKFPIYHLYH